MKRRSILIKNDKRAVSAIVGYVLVITFGIIMSAIVYNYLRTYVPKDIVKCPSGVSIFLKDYAYDRDSGDLLLKIKNNGKFSIAGYYIHGAEDVNQKVATINLVNNFSESPGVPALAREDSYILFSAKSSDYMKPNFDVVHVFSLGPNSNINLIEITPVRFEKSGNTVKFSACGDATIREELK
jgi:hypothetical protein